MNIVSLVGQVISIIIQSDIQLYKPKEQRIGIILFTLSCLTYVHFSFGHFPFFYPRGYLYTSVIHRYIHVLLHCLLLCFYLLDG